MSNCRHTTDGAALDDLVQTCCPCVNSSHWHHYHPVVQFVESIHSHYHCVRAVQMKVLQLRHHINHHLHRSRLPVNQKSNQTFVSIPNTIQRRIFRQNAELRTFSTGKCYYV